MLDIKSVQSENHVTIKGILSTLEIEEKTTADNRDYVVGKATIKVDQDVNGKMISCEPTVRFFSMKYTTTGSLNQLYPRIVAYKDQFKSLAACPEDQPELASKVEINNADISENVWIDASGNPQSTFQINGRFMNHARNYDENPEQAATFELGSVVVLGKSREVVNGEETGRLKVKTAVIGYNGKVNLIELIADSESAVTFIENNWEEGDTVNVSGYINVSKRVKTWMEPQGFGPDIKRTKTESCKELIILGGSPSGADESCSYNVDDVKMGLKARQEYVEAQKSRTRANNATSTSKKSNQFGF